MNASRFLTGAAALSLALTLAACGGEDGPGDTPPSKGKANASSPAKQQPTGRLPGDTSLPKASTTSNLPAAQAANGLVLVQQDEAGGCVVLTYDGGKLRRLGTFRAIQARNTPSTQKCDGRVYSQDFRTRVQELDNRVVVQPIDGQPKVLTNGHNPVVGPKDKVYYSAGKSAFNSQPAVMNLDGSDSRALPGGRSRPGWLGDKLVDAEGANKSASNADGTLAVEYIADIGSSAIGASGYRVGKVRDDGKGYGPTVEGKTVFPTGGQASKPLAWIGTNQFLTSVSNVTYVNTIVMSGAKPTVTAKELVRLPEQYGDDLATDVVDEMTVCGDVAYFTVALGGTTAVPDKQSVILGLNPHDGTLTAHASVLNAGTTGTQYSTKTVGCVQ